MRALSAIEILDVWERGANRRSAELGLLLLSTAAGGAAPDQLAELSVGRRDALLLKLRELTFGPGLPCLATCPACPENLECDLNVGDLLVGPDVADQPSLNRWSLQLSDCEVHFRLPNSRDLLSLSPTSGVSGNRRRLFQACVLSARRGGQDIAADELPEGVTTAVVERLAELDAQADLQLRLDCPACGHRWEAPFDIVSFLWAEVQAAAARLLHEAHELASAYGWREADILAMTPARRQAYLELIR